MLVLLLGTHLFLTIRLKFIQRHIGLGIKLSVSRDKDAAGDVSQFGGSVDGSGGHHRHGQHRRRGDGHRVGRARRGAVDVADRRVRHRDQIRRGPAGRQIPRQDHRRHNARRPDVRPGTGLEASNGSASLFCVFTAIAAFGIGNMVQANSIASLAKKR